MGCIPSVQRTGEGGVYEPGDRCRDASSPFSSDDRNEFPRSVGQRGEPPQDSGSRFQPRAISQVSKIPDVLSSATDVEQQQQLSRLDLVMNRRSSKRASLTAEVSLAQPAKPTSLRQKGIRPASMAEQSPTPEVPLPTDTSLGGVTERPSSEKLLSIAVEHSSCPEGSLARKNPLYSPTMQEDDFWTVQFLQGAVDTGGSGTYQERTSYAYPPPNCTQPLIIGASPFHGNDDPPATNVYLHRRSNVSSSAAATPVALTAQGGREEQGMRTLASQTTLRRSSSTSAGVLPSDASLSSSATTRSTPRHLRPIDPEDEDAGSAEGDAPRDSSAILKDEATSKSLPKTSDAPMEGSLENYRATPANPCPCSKSLQPPDVTEWDAAVRSSGQNAAGASLTKAPGVPSQRREEIRGSSHVKPARGIGHGIRLNYGESPWSRPDSSEGPSVLRRMNDLAKSKWKYVTLLVSKIAEKRSEMRAARVRPKSSSSSSSCSARLGYVAPPHARGERRTNSSGKDRVSPSKANNYNESPEETVSVYDADGIPLLIPHVSDLYSNYSSTCSSEAGVRSEMSGAPDDDQESLLQSKDINEQEQQHKPDELMAETVGAIWTPVVAVPPPLPPLVEILPGTNIAGSKNKAGTVLKQGSPSLPTESPTTATVPTPQQQEEQELQQHPADAAKEPESGLTPDAELVPTQPSSPLQLPQDPSRSLRDEPRGVKQAPLSPLLVEALSGTAAEHSDTGAGTPLRMESPPLATEDKTAKRLLVGQLTRPQIVHHQQLQLLQMAQQQEKLEQKQRLVHVGKEEVSHPAPDSDRIPTLPSSPAKVTQNPLQRLRAVARGTTQMPRPQPDLSGPRLRESDAPKLDFTALTGISLEGLPKVDSPSWDLLKLMDKRRKRHVQTASSNRRRK